MFTVDNNLGYFEQMSITLALGGQKLVVFISYSESAVRVQSAKYMLEKTDDWKNECFSSLAFALLSLWRLPNYSY